MALSPRPEARARQLANLRRGETIPHPENALRHGGYAQVAAQRLDAKVLQVAEALEADLPLRSPAFAAHVTLAARAICRLEDVERFHRDRGWLDADDNPRPSVELERRLRIEVANLLADCGGSPRAAARLGLDLARTIDASVAWSEPDPKRRRALLSDLGVELEDDE